MTNTLDTISDAVLVADCLAGQREAFGQIVARYQTLICSLAYSRTGSLSQSEDLAQETFIAAWKQRRTCASRRSCARGFAVSPAISSATR